MTDPQDLKNKEKKTDSVAYQRFMLLVGKNANGLFCFFEGNADKDYYIPRVKEYVQSYEIINCQNKSNVLKARKDIAYHREYDKYKKAFFIDRDFDPLENLPDVYETPYYSIENFYVSVPVFKRILTHHFSLSEVEEDFAKYAQLYEIRQQEFHAAVLLLNAWYACLRDRRNFEAEINTTNVQLDDKFIAKIIQISLQSVTQNYDIETIKTKFPNAIPYDNEKLTEKIVQFQSAEQYHVFRGKYELFFLKTFLIELKKQVKSSRNFDIPLEEFIFQYSDLAETPACLATYLQQFT